ncbi:MAG: sulfatase family protein [Planctomycetota bacterium]
MSEQPNILILFTDMQRADTIGALGNGVIKTPNLDRLVREGVSFTNAFSPSPVCVSARCCMQYGQYSQKTGLHDNGAMPEDNGKSYPALLGEAGYVSRAVGKCHFTPQRDALRGFDSRRSQEECTASGDDYIDYLQENGFDDFEPHGARGEMYYIPQISSLPAEAHPTQWVGDESIRFIEEQEEGKPWCLYSSYIHPHPPFAPPKPWHKLYRSPLMPLPKVPEESESLYTHVNYRQNRYKYRDQGIDNQLMRNIKAHYYATISFVDYQVGRILDILEKRGELDSTLILFTSDHGEYLGDYNCFGKRAMHDASSRIPMLVRYPKLFEAGKRVEAPVSLVDVLPTVVRAAGVERSDLDIDGLPMQDVASGRTDRELVYSQHGRGQSAIYMAVSRTYKYVYSAGDNREFLFDRLADPEETRNLANNAFAGGAGQEMREKLLKYLQSVGEADAYEEVDGGLRWKVYPALDQGYLDDPDAGLLIQDYAPAPISIPGYTD